MEIDSQEFTNQTKIEIQDDDQGEPNQYYKVLNDPTIDKEQLNYIESPAQVIAKDELLYTYDPNSGSIYTEQDSRLVQKNQRILKDMQFLETLQQMDITGDQGVIKYYAQETVLLQNQYGVEKPQKNSRCYIKYESRKLNGEAVDIYRDVKSVKKIKLNDENLIYGMRYALLSMSKGECNWFRFSRNYHYASQVEEYLYYQIELVDIINPEEQLSNTDYDRRWTMIQAAHLEGNQFFQQNNIEKSKKKYLRGLGILRSFPKELKQILTSEQISNCREKDKLISLNLSLICIKEQNWVEGISYANSVIEYEPNNLKAYFRKAVCLMMMQEFDESINILENLHQEAPLDIEITDKLNLCKTLRKQFKSKEKKIYSSMINNHHQEAELDEKNKKIQIKNEQKSKIFENENVEIYENFNKFNPKKKEVYNIQDLQKGIIFDVLNENNFIEMEDE